MSIDLKIADEPEKPVLSRRQERNRDAIRRGLVAYHPRRCKEKILSIVKVDQWTGFISLANEINVCVDLLDDMLEMMVRWGILEKAPLYFGPHTSADRLKHPPMNPPKYLEYHGFEFGYRLKNSEAQRQAAARKLWRDKAWRSKIKNTPASRPPSLRSYGETGKPAVRKIKI